MVTTYEYDRNGRLVYTVAPRGDEEDQEEEGKPEGTDETSSGNGAPSSNGKGAGKGSAGTQADEPATDTEDQLAEDESAGDEWVTTEYTYDAAGRLVEVYQDGGPNHEKYVDYTYDGDGNRVGLVAHVEEPGDNGLHLGWYKADKVKDGDPPGNGHDNGNGGGNGGGNGNAGGNGSGNGQGDGPANVPPGQAKKDAPDGTKGNAKGHAKGGRPDVPGRSGEAHGKGKAKGKDKSNKNKVYDLELNYVNDVLAQLPEVLATYDGEGKPRDTFLYGLQRLAGIGPDGQSTVYVYDGLGSVRQLADAQGAIFDRYTYSPYGLPAANGRLNPSHKLNDGNTFGFGGQDHDPVFGQVYLRARYYSASLGRFAAPDPLVLAGLGFPSPSQYAYANDNPLSYSDRTGLVGQPTGSSSYGGTHDAEISDAGFGVIASVSGGTGIGFLRDPLKGTQYYWETPRGSAVLEINDSTLGRVKNGKPVGDWVFKVDVPDKGMKDSPHVVIRAIVEGKKNPHIRVPEVVLKIAKNAEPIAKGIGTVLVGVGIGLDAADLARAVKEDNGTIGPNTVKEASGIAGSWAGGLAGAEVGAQVGSAIGTAILPGVGTAIGGGRRGSGWRDYWGPGGATRGRGNRGGDRSWNGVARAQTRRMTKGCGYKCRPLNYASL